MITTVTATLMALSTAPSDALIRNFVNPPETARPWVYWYFMDGNVSKQGLTADLEAMKAAGIGGAIYLEVDLGIPRGPVKFMSPEWREMFTHAVHEADRLGIEIALGTGPGWCGTGGPWVKPEQSMQHLVSTETKVTGPIRFDGLLPQPQPREPFFGEGTMTPELAAEWRGFYRDVAVIAFPTPRGTVRLSDIDEKALVYRAPYSSRPGVVPQLDSLANYPEIARADCVDQSKLVDLTSKLDATGKLNWQVPNGDWTILRLGRTITGQVTRPAPLPGLGFETDKFDRSALDAHFEQFSGALADQVGKASGPNRGLTSAHFDSWEMSSQNWSAEFRTQFQKLRGYDPLPSLPAMFGYVVGTREKSERFLWDLRRTAQQLVVQNHVNRLAELAHQRGMKLSIEPYDMNPAGDLDLGSAADIPMCEFWSKDYGFKTEYSCFESVSIAHVFGRPVVGAEAFTANPGEDWRQYPGSMKDQTDWALCNGINRITFHRMQHQPWLDREPGMTMGRYGVHWDRTQTWWPMASGYHTYLARSQELLRQGTPVVDILYLAPEGAPTVFHAPKSATLAGLPDHRGHSFDGCSADMLMTVTVKDHRIVFPSGMSYAVLVLPNSETMTPQLLQKVNQLASLGAKVIGNPPVKSPSLEKGPDYGELLGETTRWTASPTPEKTTNPFLSSKWIWTDVGDPLTAAPVGQATFVRHFDFAGHGKEATLAITADNSFVAKLNGKVVLKGDSFHENYRVEVGKLLASKNTLEVVVTNSGSLPNPAGMLCSLMVGDTSLLVSDASWVSAGKPAKELCAWDGGPWNKAADVETPEIYPSYEFVVSTLGGVPDFEANADLRFIHRSTADAEIYMVGNRTQENVTADCRFRVKGRQAELWNAVTGERFALPSKEMGSVTRASIHFDPSQSWFVVFPKQASVLPQVPAVGHPRPLDLVWKVSFQNGPQDVAFQTLQDWTTRSEPAIRNYSGIATYTTQFDAHKPDAAGWLDLGKVEVMAKVWLNGHDLGVVWCAPWRVSIPKGVLKAKGNDLKIEVANLWCNRLIADSGLPEDQHTTWTTYNPFSPQDKLLPSGLLGPIKLVDFGH